MNFITPAYSINSFKENNVNQTKNSKKMDQSSGLEIHLQRKSNSENIDSLKAKSVKSITETEKTSVNIDSFNINQNFDLETTVKFNQNNLINGTQALPSKLMKINIKFNGLCELICNKVLIDDLLGKGNGDFLEKEITVNQLNKKSILKSHLLNVYSVFHRMIAFLFGVYPNNLFSVNKQWNLIKRRRVNQKILFNGLKKIEPGTILKLEIFKRTITSFSGHSMLIKKTKENEFIFFDPDSGEHRGLSQHDLAECIDVRLAHGGTDVFLSRGDAYIKKLKNKKIIEKAKNTLNPS